MLTDVPYVTCAHCRVTNYVALSYLSRGERCLACDQALDQRARAACPALLLTVADRNRVAPDKIAPNHPTARGPDGNRSAARVQPASTAT